MFKRPRHQRIAHVLSALDADVLRAYACWFGGGTCIALRFGEYRESVDIDFLVSDAAGYRDLRELLTGPSGLAPITRVAASKLLANSDRQADDGVFSRDVIDLAMMDLALPALRAALRKAEQAYGVAVTRDLAKALSRLQAREGWLDRCMRAMAMEMPKAVLWQKIRRLKHLLPDTGIAA